MASLELEGGLENGQGLGSSMSHTQGPGNLPFVQSLLAVPKGSVCPLRGGLWREGDEWQSRGSICPTVPKHGQVQKGD